MQQSTPQKDMALAAKRREQEGEECWLVVEGVRQKARSDKE
jgi:hypothetical protein